MSFALDASRRGDSRLRKNATISPRSTMMHAGILARLSFANNPLKHIIDRSVLPRPAIYFKACVRDYLVRLSLVRNPILGACS